MDTKDFPTKPIEVIETYIAEHQHILRLESDEDRNQFYCFISGDREIAEMITDDTGIEITRGSVNAFRRRNFVAGLRIKAARTQDSGHGGAREGAGRKTSYEYAQEALEKMENGNVVDFQSPGALKLLNRLCVNQLSRSCPGQGLTGGTRTNDQKTNLNKLQEIQQKMQKKNGVQALTLTEATEVLRQLQQQGLPQNPFEDEDVHEIFSEAINVEATGKITRMGGKTNIAKGQYYAS